VRDRLHTWVLPTLALWALCLATWTGLLFAEDISGCDELVAGDSNYGVPSWGWTPPGVTCTWPIRGQGEHVEPPPSSRYGIIGLLILWPATTLLIGRLNPSGDGAAAGE
jgi:hypothetical protein